MVILDFYDIADVVEQKMPYNFFSLYITQEEFWIDAGHYVPQLADLVYERNKDKKANLYINLKGFIVSIFLLTV